MISGLVGQKYQVTSRIGGGSFGEIYMGYGPNKEKVSNLLEKNLHNIKGDKFLTIGCN
jgi:hypothetical protein